MKKVLSLLSKPILDKPTYFIFFFILIGIPEICMGIYQEYLTVDRFNWAIINVTATIFLISYIFSLLLLLLPSKIKSIYIYTTLILAIVHFIGSIFLIQMHGDVLNADIMSIILNSNKVEMMEYISMYVSVTYFLLLIVIFICILASYYLINKYVCSAKFNYILIGLILIVSFGLTIRRPIYWGDLFPYKYIKGFNSQNAIPDLSEYVKDLDLFSFKNIRPKNFVLIIGESFSKYHSSLYGYNKNTNPLLSKYISDSLLYVYSDVISPATHTIECFQNIMSTYRSEFEDSIAWYECVTLIDILKKAEYETCWISNQSKRGINDNVPSRYAELCDTALFAGNKFAGAHRNTYDEEIIPLLKSLFINKDKNRFYICHLMGSHFQFNKRYPRQFERFRTQDYEDYPESQRKHRASYDNSILYNDSVVYELMNLFMDKEAIVFYFPDHALDVFQSSDEYIGHGKYLDLKSVKAGSSIPFMIFTSPLYQKRFPNEMKMIKDCINRPFRTDDMIFTLMDLIGVSFEDESLDGKSLFRL